ncbi:hypothetical protein KC19_7G052400 [Ceratodon purpureus]|uniref:Secreted protein n=1 Tax=Ceratodon purpureus TaxID=3225 RepID=A0A8T0H310_CERPU|nr:hypothetical protein KC19_7G052400 [Ceratodon purpureus]
MWFTLKSLMRWPYCSWKHGYVLVLPLALLTNTHCYGCRNENVLIIFAVGNQGILGKGTVASPASSKNCLAVCTFSFYC